MKPMITLLITFAVFSAAFVILWRWYSNPKAQQRKPIYVNRIIIDGVNYQLALQHLRECEGLSLEAYQQGDKWYIGYGHQIQPSQEFLYDGCTQAYAESLLERDLQHCILFASKRYNLTGNQALAVGLLMFNLGAGRVRQYYIDGEPHTTMVHAMLIGKEDFDEDVFRTSWLSFCRNNGKVSGKLKQRRQFELNLFAQ